jgi:hypothetical protein
MWILVVLLGIIGFFHFVMSVSLLDRKRNILLVSIAVAIVPIIHHHFALQTNFNEITDQLGNLEFTSGMVALEIAIIFLTTYFSANIIQSHFESKKTIKRFFALIPSVFFVIGILLGQLWIFNEVSGFSYLGLTAHLALGVFVLVWGFVGMIKILLKDWTLRLELKSLFSFLLIMGAMLLPIFFQNVTIIKLNTTSVNIQQSAMITGLILVLTVVGYFNYKHNITKRIWSRFTKS